MKKSSIFTLIILTGILIVAGYFAWKSIHPSENPTNSEAARSLTADGDSIVYSDLEGNQVHLEKYAGKVRVVNSWATWCPFCANELKDFNELAAQYSSDEVVVIAINRKEPVGKVKAYLSQLGTFDNLIFVQDKNDSFYKSIAGFAMPETVFYNTDGTVFLHKRGFMNLTEMQRHVADMRNLEKE